MSDSARHSATGRAIFAGGCFWCMVPPFEKLDGVLSVTAGFDGGTSPAPTYSQVCSGATEYAEAVEVVFAPHIISYQELLQIFWKNIDPTDGKGQFADRGRQYRTAIFYLNDEQRQQAEASRAVLDASGTFDRPVVTEVVPSTTFYPAEDYHQDYHRKAPLHYQSYRQLSGRGPFLERQWNRNIDK